jgi:exodeoxyribonuclease V gamma subunit
MPPAALGGATLDAIRAQVEPLLAASQRYLVGQPEAVDVVVPLGDDRRLTGTVTGVRGTTLVRTVFSRLGAKHRLRAWIQLLALSAAFPDQTFDAVTIGRGEVSKSKVALLTAPERPAETLKQLVELYDEAMCAPLPLPLATSYAYAHPRTGGGDEADALQSAKRELATAEEAANGRGGFEAVDDYHRLAFGDPFTFDALRRTHSDKDRARAPFEKTRFGALSMTLWAELLRHEQVAHA